MTTSGTTTRAMCAVMTVLVATAAGCGGPSRRITGDGGPSTDFGSIPPGCTSPAACADANDCTTDTCDTVTGVCRHILTPALCAAGESCNPITGCEPGRACATATDCADTDACTTDERCDPVARVCTYRPLDGDEDGDPPRVCGGSDCDDSRFDVFVGAAELCDLSDNDCDGAVDEGASAGCDALQVCSAGRCECAAGTTNCGGLCVDVTSDPANCGACYGSCDTGATCVASACVCGGGLTSCGSPGGPSYCVDTASSRFDCGVCGRTCASADSCIAGVCVGMDAGPPPPDLGPRDAGPDAGRVDMGTAACNVGRACTPALGCPGSLACQDEIAYTLGGAADEPIYLPSGATTTFTGLYFEGGYCTNAELTTAASREGSAGACNPAPVDETPGFDGCPACAKCISIGPDTTGVNIVQCYQRCAPAAATNPCRSGYTCDFASDVCIFGCQTDQECQLYREDTNGDGVAAAPDRLRLDVAGSATCSAATGRCTQPGTPGVVAGATCVLDSQCERDGRCLSELSYSGWIDGYCTKFGCDVLGCAGAGKCLDAGGGTNICTNPCRVADDVGDPATGAGAGDDDCRTGYACFWDGFSPASATVNGGCLPGNYNAITVENIGASCVDPDGATGPRSSDDVCWSPYGLGRCVFGDAIASCTIVGCSMLPPTACGVGNACVTISADTSLCLRTCTTPADCSADSGRASNGCVDETGMGGAVKHCFPGCMVDADCGATYRCVGATATALGECVLR